MSDQKHPAVDYVNSVIYGLAKSFWEERGSGSKFKVTLVGWDYFLSQALPKAQSFEQAFVTVKTLLQRDKVVDHLSCEMKESAVLEGTETYGRVKVLELQAQGCVHLPVERQMMDSGIAPYVCPVTNVLCCAIETSQNVSTELAAIDIADDTCNVKLVLFDHRST